MVEIYGTDNGIVHALDSYSDGCWVKMTEPTSEEVGALSRFFDIDTDDMQAAMDEEEQSRIVLEDNYTLVIVDIPASEIQHDKIF